MKSKLLLLTLFSFLIILKTKAQDVKLISVNQLESRFKQGKDTIYVVNFWATWCKPCVNELPEFEKFKSANQGKPVKVILISTDLRSKLEIGVKPFVKTHHLTGEVYLLNEAPSSFTERISPDWSGALPGTLIFNSKTGQKKFHESAYTYAELSTAIK
ncbi:TlpA disulfide reductase family protein [Mucilaginibacter terrae]|uniref:TlpA disulfide reductase family protein n=1 Tax=Mucilaginibacter terrae TaxID=1955052 RepID=UPI003643013D